MGQKNRQFVLDQIPKGKLGKEHFRLTAAPIVDGFENLPAALVGLLAGDNIGKRMVKVN